MRTPPADLPDAAVSSAVRDGWQLDLDLAYAPVGFGSHHWVAADRAFVTVDRVADPGNAARLDAAMSTAHALRHDSGLGFVVAPLPATDGTLSRRLGPWSVSVFPYVDGRALPEQPDDATCQEVLRLLRELAAATPAVEAVAGADDLGIDARDTLERLLLDVGHPWGAGPYADRARAALWQEHDAVVQQLGCYDELVDEIRTRPEPWVVTHGEPKPDNWLRTEHGLVLVDWDTVLVAPAARDRWWWAAAESGGPRSSSGRPRDVLLYELRWELTDLALYARDLSGPHEDDADTAIRWRGFELALASLRRRTTG